MQPDVLATTCCYATDIHKRSLGAGMHDDSLDRIGEIKGELLMIWGRQDPHIPREGRALIYNALSDAGVLFQWHEFNAAHAFLRDEGPRYDPAVARICYGMVLELFTRRLNKE
jgi:carboxymethylenebutenolidase